MKNFQSFITEENVNDGDIQIAVLTKVSSKEKEVVSNQIKVGDDGIITDAKFKTYGCGSAIASSSLLTEWVKGQSVDEALKIKNSDIAEELALPPVKIHCSVLAEDAIKAALADYRGKQESMGKWQPNE